MIEKEIESSGVLLIERNQEQNKLKCELDKIKKYFGDTGILLIAVDLFEKVALISKKGCEILEFDEEEIVGKNWFDIFIPENERDYERDDFKKLISGEMEPFKNYEGFVLTKGGHKRIIKWENNVLNGEDGKIIGIFYLGEDVTDQKQIQEELLRQKTYNENVLNNAPDMIILVDRSWRITYINETLRQFVGIELEDILGMTLLDAANKMGILNQKSIDILSGRMKEWLKTGKPISDVELDAINYKGEEATVCYSTSVIRGPKGENLGEVIIIRDITERKKAEELLKKSEERYRMVLESVEEGYFECDFSGNLIFFNNSFCRIFGYTREELLGANAIQFMNEKSTEEAYGIFGIVYRTKKPVKVFRSEIITKDGIKKSIEGSASLIINETCRPTGFRGIIRDITERKHAEEELRESENRYSTIVEGINDGIVILQNIKLGKNIKLAFANQNVADLTGYTLDELNEMDLTTIISPKHMPKALDRYRRRMAGEDLSPYMEIEAIHKGGHIIPIEMGGTWTEYQGEKAFVIFIRDITKRKHADEEIKKTLNDLEQSNRDLEHFAYIASHDLQEPLRMIGSYLQLISRRYTGKLDSDADEFIGYAVDGAKRMQEMINDLLIYSRVGTRGKPFDHVNCEKVLEQTLSNLSILMDESKTLITHDPLPNIMADDVQIIQLFQHLISNAIKYRGEFSPQIHISVEQGENEWIFSVKDNGKGIDPLYKDQIFQVFGRMDKPQSGTGVGLAVCMKIVNRHGGRIWVESELGVGSTFYFSIPMRG